MDMLREGTLLAVTVGNTRVGMGLARQGELSGVRWLPKGDMDAILAAARELAEPVHGVCAVVASTNAPLADRLEQRLGEVINGEDVLRIGRDLHVPLRHTLDDASTLGQDRALCAIAAFERAKQACIVIDAGTAVTADFIDGEGVFHGGAIMPGAAIMLRALHEHTAALPQLSFEPAPPARGAFGKDTRHAMQLGVAGAVVGFARMMIDRYAEAYEAYPQVIATGGDAPALFADDPLIERIVPDLQLLGILATVRHELGEGERDIDDEDDQV